MAANTNPIFTVRGELSNNNATAFADSLTGAQNDYTVTGANSRLVHTAGPDGSWLRSLVLTALGTNVVSKAIVLINNGLDPTVAANNWKYKEAPLPVTTLSTTAQNGPDIEVPFNLMLPPNYRIYINLTVAVAAGWDPAVIAGDYS